MFTPYYETITMKKIIISTLLTFSYYSFAYDAQEAQSMYEKDCTKCHDSSVFTRPAKERKVNDLATLKKQVSRCVGATGASWFEEDEENVVQYLNEKFYKFAKGQAAK